MPLLRAAPALVERGDLRIVEPHGDELPKRIHRRRRRHVDLARVRPRAEAFREIVLVFGLQVPAARQVDLHARSHRGRIRENADVVTVDAIRRTGHRGIDDSLAREKRRQPLPPAIAGRHRSRHRRPRAEETRGGRDHATDHDVRRHRLRRDVGRTRDLRRIARRDRREIALLVVAALRFVHRDRLRRLRRDPHGEPITHRLAREKRILLLVARAAAGLLVARGDLAAAVVALRDDVDHARRGAGAVDRAAGSGQHLDALDGTDGHIVDRSLRRAVAISDRRTRDSRWCPPAVDKDDRVAVVPTPQRKSVGPAIGKLRIGNQLRGRCRRILREPVAQKLLQIRRARELEIARGKRLEFKRVLPRP